MFYVFKKSHRKKIDYLTSFSEEVKDRILKGIKENNIKEGRKFLSDGKAVQNICHADTKEYEYVDLGLPSGLKWAKCNVGAEKETDYGFYFQWGDIEDRTDAECSWTTYKHCNGTETSLTKYNIMSEYETVDNKITLDPEDDAAKAHMGGDWRMPTDDDFQELLDNTTIEWVDNYNGSGVNGMKFISKTDTTKYIFIPASGHHSGSSFYGQGIFGDIWSSSLIATSPNLAWKLSFLSGFIDEDYYYGYRCIGYVVRGVMN